jgi:CheY-like chemotaxis protein
VFDVDLRGADYAWAEELLCYSLLANLVKNAVEASPQGGRVLLLAEGGDGAVRLHIHNEGEVPAAVRSRLFQKYVTAGKASGSGLGTYSARLMARVQDGDVGMRSSAADGTTLTVTLRAAPQGVTPAAARHLSERGRAGRPSIGSLPPQRVLLVDDDEYNLLIVRRYLPTPPFSVDTATDGRMALDAANRNWPDVVIMDLDMPVMGGLAAVGALRSMEREKGARRGTMIALSSHEDEATRIAALAAGFDHYLTKPVTRDAIHDTLLALAGGRTSTTPVRRAGAIAGRARRAGAGRHRPAAGAARLPGVAPRARRRPPGRAAGRRPGRTAPRRAPAGRQPGAVRLPLGQRPVPLDRTPPRRRRPAGTRGHGRGAARAPAIGAGAIRHGRRRLPGFHRSRLKEVPCSPRN